MSARQSADVTDRLLRRSLSPTSLVVSAQHTVTYRAINVIHLAGGCSLSLNQHCLELASRWPQRRDWRMKTPSGGHRKTLFLDNISMPIALDVFCDSVLQKSTFYLLIYLLFAQQFNKLPLSCGRCFLPELKIISRLLRYRVAACRCLLVAAAGGCSVNVTAVVSVHLCVCVLLVTYCQAVYCRRPCQS